MLLALALLVPLASSIIQPGAKLEKLRDGFAFTEGPATDREGNVYFTDQPNDRIWKWTTDGKFTAWMHPCGRSNGMFFDPHGNLIACADENNQLWSIAPDQKVTVLVKDFEGKLLNGPNDAWVRPDGGIYFTDPLYEREYWKRSPESQQTGHHLYFLSADRKTLKTVDSEFNKPNGLIGASNGKTLYVADIGANITYRYQIEANGSLVDKHLFCHLGSDGMTLDSEGDVYLTGHGITVFNPAGEQIEHIDVPETWTGNITFAGKDRHLLFVTASHCVYGLRMRVKGAH